MTDTFTVPPLRSDFADFGPIPDFFDERGPELVRICNGYPQEPVKWVRPGPNIGYDRIALRRSRNWNRIFSHIILVLLTGTGICFSKSGSGRTGTGIFGS